MTFTPFQLPQILLLCLWGSSLFGQGIMLMESATHPYFGSLYILVPDVRADNDRTQEQWKEAFAVYPDLEPTDRSSLPAMLGNYKLEGDTLFFRPRFPFQEGRAYQAKVDLFPQSTELHYSIIIPKRTFRERPKVEALYPSSDVWPANQLKFYIFFSQPMKYGEVYQHIHLLDASGKKVKDPFIDLGEELWDSEQKRLTVWFDPGRIKRSLQPNIRMGAPLQPDREYTLLIDATWQGANGQQLEMFSKRIVTTTRDGTKPDPKEWQLKIPGVGTLEALEVIFPEPMDFAVLKNGLGIFLDNGVFLPGKVLVAEEEKSWLFRPSIPWKQGRYTLRITTDLEDLAGNNLIRLFDTDVQEGAEEKIEKPFIQIPFSVN